LGGCATLWIHALTGGRWGHVLRPALVPLVARRAWLVPLFIPIAIGFRSLYPWATGDGGAFKTLDEPAFAQAWLSLPAFGVRCALYAAAMAWLPSSAHRPTVGRARAAVSLMAFGLLGSLAATDFLMSLVPGWRSAGFPLLVLVSQLLGGAAALVAWCALRMPHTLRSEAAADVPVARDLGNLLLMFVMVWGYLGFMQFLIIWAENLPPEISWFVPRLQTGWYAVGVALVALQLAVPMVALVMRRLKDRPPSLAVIALVVLGAHALDAVWLVVPSVAPHSLATWWLAPLCIAGMSLLLFAPCMGVMDSGEAVDVVDAARGTQADAAANEGPT
ncbi:MAG: hypothetical protein JWQ73_2429, partial [Variovorax sp.]|nr:hypothetical protein [Variovorax sp.]